jgi:hypothetical protein
MNRDFLARTYRTTLVTLGIVSLFVLSYRGPREALGFGLAALLGVLNVRFIESIAGSWIREGGPRKGRVALAVALKLVLVYGGGFALLASGLAPPIVLAAGFTLIFAVLFLKSLGLLYLVKSGTLRQEAPPRGNTKEELP